jgi:WD40 repeat protein
MDQYKFAKKAIMLLSFSMLVSSFSLGNILFEQNNRSSECNLSQIEQIESVEFATYSPTADDLAFIFNRNFLCISNLRNATHRLLMRFEGGSASLSWSQDGSLLVLGEINGQITIINAATGRSLRTFYYGHVAPSVQLSPNNEFFVTGDASSINSIEFRNAVTGELLTSIDVSERSSPGRFYDTRIEALDWHPTMPLVVTVGRRGVVIVLEVEENRLVSYWSDIDGFAPYLNRLRDLPMFTVDWHPNDPNVILTGGGDVENEYDNTYYHSEGRLLLWELSSQRVQRPLASLEGHNSVVSAAAFSPDGNWIISADEETIRLWNYETRENVWTTAFELANSVSWSSDGRQIAVSSSNGHLRLYDFYEGRLEEAADLPGG